MDARKKVFLCTDTLVQHRSYYVVAESVAQAEEGASTIQSPAYLEDDDAHLEYEDTVVNEEVATIFLVGRSSLAADDTPPQILRLIPTGIENADAYRGYLVEDDTVEVSLEEQSYPKTEWQLYQQSKG